MLDKNTLIKVRNRDNGSVGYTIPDLGNLHRNFMSGEVKEVTFEELQKLSYLPGGEFILKEYLVIEDSDEAVSTLLGEVEPEYRYTEDDVKTLLLEGSLEELQDCLDFAPEGTVNLVKKVAVEMELNDIRKRDAIKNKLGFDVNSAIRVNKESQDGEDESEQKTRRVATPTVAAKATRTAAPAGRYKVVNK